MPQRGEDASAAHLEHDKHRDTPGAEKPGGFAIEKELLGVVLEFGGRVEIMPDCFENCPGHRCRHFRNCQFIWRDAP